MKNMFRLLCCYLIAAAFASCEKAIFSDNEEVVTLRFTPTFRDVTTRGVDAANYFSKLNIQMFDADGNKVFEQVKTQTREDANFGHVSCMLSEGSYTVVAVGHSSIRSATIKSPFISQNIC